MLTEFNARLQSHGLAHPNRYKIHFSGQGPSLAGGWQDSIGMMCETIEFPGQTFQSAPDTLRYGPPREADTNVIYAPITATFICDYKMNAKKWFEAWQRNMMDMNTWEPNYYRDYTGDLKIYQLERDNSSKYVVSLYEVYPKTIASQPLGHATNDSYHTVSVEFMYHHWEYVAEETPDARQSPTRISVSFGINTAVKKAVFSQALTAIGNYQAEQAAAGASGGSPGDPKGRQPKPQAGNPQVTAAAQEMNAAALRFLKGGLEKSSGNSPDPGVLPTATSSTSSLAGLPNAATGASFGMAAAFNGTFSRSGGMKVTLGGQFNMRMKTPNLPRMRGMPNMMSQMPSMNAAVKLKSMFSGGGGGMSFGGMKLPGMGVGSMIANAGKMGGKASFGGAMGGGEGSR